jgi:hypothetical protein
MHNIDREEDEHNYISAGGSLGSYDTPEEWDPSKDDK